MPPSDCVDVWIADWNSAANRNFKEVMSDAELDRAARFYFERHRLSASKRAMNSWLSLTK